MDMEQQGQGREQWRRVTDVRSVSVAFALALKLAPATVERGWFSRDERGALVFVEYRVRDAGRSYLLRYVARHDDAPCPCPRGIARHACWHRGAAIILGRDLRRIFAPSRAEA